MSPNRPLTMSLPIGLFSSATLTAPVEPPAKAEVEADAFPFERELLDMPTFIPEMEGLDEDIYWDDGA